MKIMDPSKGKFIGNCASEEERRKIPAGSAKVPPGYRKRQSPKLSFVLLPAAGYRNGTSVNNAGSNGNYWSSTYNNSNNAYNLNFNSGNVNPSNNNNRYNGQSVRLVRLLSLFSTLVLDIFIR